MYKPITDQDLDMLRECNYGGIGEHQWNILLFTFDRLMKETNMGFGGIWACINVADYDNASERLNDVLRTYDVTTWNVD